MAVLHPSVNTPLSPCSSYVQLSGAFPGATIDVYANNRQVVSGRTAIAPKQNYELDPGEELHSHELVWAAQTVDGERSSDEVAREHGVSVMDTPSGSQMGSLTWRSHLYVCGYCVRLTGAIPGAVVTIRDSLGEDLGTATAVTTRVKPILNRPISGGETLVAEYQVCEEDGPSTHSPTHSPTPEDPVEIPTPLPDPLRQPRIQDPLLACGQRVQVMFAYEGAHVTVSRAAMGDRQFCTTITNPYRDYSQAEQLEEGETVTVRQGFPECQPLPDETESARVVGPADDLTVPEIEGPLCEGSLYLRVHGLVPYATVRIYNNSEEHGRICAESTSQTMEIPPLASGTVYVSQELCSVVQRSSDVVVGSCEPPGRPQLTRPYECAAYVHVSNVLRGVRVRIFSSNLGWIGDTVAQGTETLIPVPALSSAFGHQLRPVAYYADEELSGDWQGVRILLLGLGDLTPHIRTALTGDRSVEVENIVPGSVVEVYVDGELWGSTQAGGLVGHIENGTLDETRIIVAVALLGTLSDNHSIQARQHFCERESGVSEVISPVRCRGRIQVGLKSLDPSPVWWDQLQAQVNWMQRLLRRYGFDVRIIHEEVLDLPHLRNLSTDDAEFDELIGFRDGLAENDIAVYLVNSIEDVRSASGVSIIDFNFAITELGSEYYVVAHEVGHSLGLECDYSAHSSRLMYPGGREPGIHEFPSIFDDSALTAAETDTMAASTFIYPC